MAKKTEKSTRKHAKKSEPVEEIILEAPATEVTEAPITEVAVEAPAAEVAAEASAPEAKRMRTRKTDIHRYDPKSGMTPVSLCGTSDGTMADRNEVTTCPACIEIIRENRTTQRAFHLYKTPWGLIATKQQIDGARVLVATNLLHHAHGLSGRGPMRFDALPAWIQSTTQALLDMGILALSDGYLVSQEALYFAGDGQADALGFDPLSAIRFDARPICEARDGLASEVAPPAPPPPVQPAYLTPEERQAASKYLVAESGEVEVDFDLPSPPMVEVLGAVRLAPPYLGPPRDTTFSFEAEPDSTDPVPDETARSDVSVAVVRKKAPEAPVVPEPLPTKPWSFDEE